MNKKLFIGAACAISLFALSACNNGSSEDYNILRKDYPVDAEILSELTVVNKATATRLGKAPEEEKNYYDVYVATNTLDSLFLYQYDMEGFFGSEMGERVLSVHYSTYSFKDTVIYDSEKAALISTVFDEENGVGPKLKELGFEKTFKETTYYTEIDAKDAYKAYVKGEKISLAVVYLPVLFEHKYQSATDTVLSANLYVPVYATFVSASGKEVSGEDLVDSSVKGIRVANLDAYLEKSSEFGTIPYTMKEESKEEE